MAGSKGDFGRRSVPQLGQNFASAGILALHFGQLANTVLVEVIGMDADPCCDIDWEDCVVFNGADVGGAVAYGDVAVFIERWGGGDEYCEP